jgi:hypothetical protein
MFLERAKVDLASVVDHLQTCNNAKSRCRQLLVEALALMKTKKPTDTSEDVMSILEAALTEVSTLQPMYTPPAPWDVPMPVSKPPTKRGKTTRTALSNPQVYQKYKNTALKPIKPKKQVEFNLDNLKQDVTAYIKSVISNIIFMNPPQLTRSTPSQTLAAQLRLMRACLDRQDFRRSAGI